MLISKKYGYQNLGLGCFKMQRALDNPRHDYLYPRIFDDLACGIKPCKGWDFQNCMKQVIGSVTRTGDDLTANDDIHREKNRLT
jgi:hypothetical protein